jgi:hypothetical protein
MSPLSHWIPQILLAVGVVNWASWAFVILSGQARHAIPPMVIAVGLFVALTRSESFTTWIEGMHVSGWDASAQMFGFPAAVFLCAFAVSALIAAVIDCYLPTRGSDSLMASRVRKHVAQFQVVALVAVAVFAFSKAPSSAISQSQRMVGIGVVVLIAVWNFMPKRKGAT